jgi:sugar-specific transcriptional regulator TrmB
MLDRLSLDVLGNTKMNEKQAAVYLSLLMLGNSSVTKIAEEAGLKRAITYVVLQELQAMGYATLVPSEQKKRIYSAIDPNTLASQLDQTAASFKEMLPYLRAMQRRAGKPYVTYYNGVEGARQAFAQILRPKDARYAISIKKASQHIPDEVERWKRQYAHGKARPGGRHLLTNSPEDHAYGQVLTDAGQVVRYIRSEEMLNMDLALVDDMAFITTFEETVHVTVIHSPALYRSFGVIYDLAWAASEL